MSRFPVRLVTAQIFTSTDIDEDAKNQADRAVSGLYAGLSSLSYEVRAQSSEDADIDFCTLVQADDTCLSKGEEIPLERLVLVPIPTSLGSAQTCVLWCLVLC